MSASSVSKCRQRYSGEPEKLLTANEVAALLGVSIPTLTRWRQDGVGPRFLKLGATRKSAVRYRPVDVRAYVADCERRSTGANPGTRRSEVIDEGKSE